MSFASDRITITKHGQSFFLIVLISSLACGGQRRSDTRLSLCEESLAQMIAIVTRRLSCAQDVAA